MSLLEYRHPRNGWSIRELAEKVGASPSSISKWSSAPREEYLGRAEARRQKIIELHKLGWSGKRIAQELNVTPALVSIRLREARESGVLGECSPSNTLERSANTE